MPTASHGAHEVCVCSALRACMCSFRSRGVHVPPPLARVSRPRGKRAHSEREVRGVAVAQRVLVHHLGRPQLPHLACACVSTMCGTPTGTPCAGRAVPCHAVLLLLSACLSHALAWGLRRLAGSAHGRPDVDDAGERTHARACGRGIGSEVLPGVRT